MASDPNVNERSSPQIPGEIWPTGQVEANRPLPSVAAINGQANCLVDPSNGKMIAVDSQVADWLGGASDQFENHILSDLLPTLTQDHLDKLDATARRGPLNLKTSIRKRDGATFQAVIDLTPLMGSEKAYLLVTIRPAQNTDEQSLRCDALTGLPDRRELSAHRSRWQQASSGQQLPHALLFLDLDKFKQINDRHGHAMGDRLLTTLANRWQRCIRENDLLVRYGGDEFIVLLAGIRQQQEVEPIVNRLLAAATKPIAVDGQQLQVGATIGIALAEDTSVSLDQLIATADRDMYRQKR